MPLLVHRTLMMAMPPGVTSPRHGNINSLKMFRVQNKFQDTQNPACADFLLFCFCFLSPRNLASKHEVLPPNVYLVIVGTVPKLIRDAVDMPQFPIRLSLDGLASSWWQYVPWRPWTPGTVVSYMSISGALGSNYPISTCRKTASPGRIQQGAPLWGTKRDSKVQITYLSYMLKYN